jgi:hypothetical protein
VRLVLFLWSLESGSLIAIGLINPLAVYSPNQTVNTTIGLLAISREPFILEIHCYTSIPGEEEELCLLMDSNIYYFEK